MGKQTTPNKINEYYLLRNRLEKYWKKLVKESFRIAEEKGLEVIVSDDFNFKANENQIVIFKQPEFNDSAFLKIAKEKFPTLYRKYNHGLERLRELKFILGEKYISFNSHIEVGS